MARIQMKKIWDNDSGTYHQFIDDASGEIIGELEGRRNRASLKVESFKATYFALDNDLVYFYAEPFDSRMAALAWIKDFHRLFDPEQPPGVKVSFSARLEVDLNSDCPEVNLV